MKTILFVVVISLAALLVPMQIELEQLQKLAAANKVRLDDYKMHSKTPCMALPDNTPCWDKTVHFRMPGGSLRKELRRICAFTSPKAQVWKDEI
jgi:hypothetical protein